MKARLGALLIILVIGSLAAAGFVLYESVTEKDRQIAEQNRVVAALGQRLDRSWAEEIVADVRVDALARDPDGGQPEMTLTFAQYAPGTETPSLRKTMTLPGDEFYIDALVVEFQRKLVEEGDGLRGKSLLFFRRAFGDRQKPVDGVPLYRHGGAMGASEDIPEGLRVDPEPGEFEREVWTRFWTYANDPRRAAEAGIRVAQGEAVHTRAVRGQVYKVTLSAGHGLSLVPRLPESADAPSRFYRSWNRSNREAVVAPEHRAAGWFTVAHPGPAGVHDPRPAGHGARCRQGRLARGCGHRNRAPRAVRSVGARAPRAARLRRHDPGRRRALDDARWHGHPVRPVRRSRDARDHRISGHSLIDRSRRRTGSGPLTNSRHKR